MSLLLLLLIPLQTNVAEVKAEPSIRCQGGRTEIDGMRFAALGLDALRRGDIKQSIQCLERAYTLLPDSPIVVRDLAQAYALRGDLKEARVLTERAIVLGDPDPEIHQLHAMLLAELGELGLSRQAHGRAKTTEGEMIGAATMDPSAADRMAGYIDEDSERGAVASLLMAAYEGRRGNLEAARRLVRVAESQALRTDALLVLNAARDLSRRIDSKYSGFSYGFRLRTALDHASNPRFLADDTSDRPTGLRLALLGEGAAELVMGRFAVGASMRVDQHVFLMERDSLSSLDLTGLALSARLRFPISKDPNLAVVGFSLRYTDVFARLFRDHYAVSIEGGPDLRLRMSAFAELLMGFYGVATDFVDGSPSNSRVSSLNRDRVGQRVLVSMLFKLGWLSARSDAIFVHDNARGDAFDAVGGGGATRFFAQVGPGVRLNTGVSVMVRQFGPVGESAIIGAAAKRTEVRTVVELGARVPLYDNIDFVLEDVWINTAARDGHEYIENVLSIGMEAWW